MTKASKTVGMLAACMIAALPASAEWNLLVDFNEFEVGRYTSGDNAPIAELVRVTRDEGFEGQFTEGFAAHNIHDNGAGGKMYHLDTGGHGVSWGHVFATIGFEPAITDYGTLYFQVAVEGISTNTNIGFTDQSTNVMDPPDEDNPWGWVGPITWTSIITQIRNDFPEGYIGFRDYNDFAHDHRGYTWVPGEWYEFWLLVDMAGDVFSVTVQGGGDQFPTQTTLQILDPDDGSEIENVGFRTPASIFDSVVFGLANGNGVENPMRNHRWFFNYIAVDATTHTLARPPNAAPLPPAIGVPAELRWGFPAVPDTNYQANAANFLGTFDGTYIVENLIPWIYQWGLNTWTYSTVFSREPTEEDSSTVHAMDSDVPAAASGSWNFITNSGSGPVTEGENINSVNFLGWIYPAQAPWVYSYDLGTWVYLATGDWTTEGGIWAYVFNSRSS